MQTLYSSDTHLRGANPAQVAFWLAMAYGGVPNHTDLTTDMADLSTPGSSTMPSSAHETAGAALAHDLVHQLGQFSLDSSPVLASKTPKFARKYTLRELEIQQTIGECLAGSEAWLLGGRVYV